MFLQQNDAYEVFVYTQALKKKKKNAVCWNSGKLCILNVYKYKIFEKY